MSFIKNVKYNVMDWKSKFMRNKTIVLCDRKRRPHHGVRVLNLVETHCTKEGGSLYGAPLYSRGEGPPCPLYRGSLYHPDGSPVNPAICEEISKFCEGFTMVVYEKIF